MVAHASEYPNQPDQESAGPGSSLIAPGPELSAARLRRRPKWFIGGAAAIALLASGAGGLAATNHMRHFGSANPATSRVAALQQWWAGARQDFTDMRNASDDVDQAFSRFRPGALAAACQHVRDAAEVKMRGHLPSPDPKLTAELTTAIKDFGFASHLCLAAVAGPPANYDGEFLSLMAQANKHLRAAQEIIDQTFAGV